MWPAIIAAGAQLAGSALGANSAHANNKMQKKAMQLQDYQFRNKTQIRMEDYRKAGINPILAGLDAGAVPAYNMTGLQNAGQPFADMGNNLANLVGNLYNAKEARKIQQQSVDNQLITQQANAEQAIAQSRLTQAQAERERQATDALNRIKFFQLNPRQVALSLYGTDNSNATTTGFNILGNGFNYGQSSSAKTLNDEKKKQQEEEKKKQQENKQNGRADRTKLLQNARHFSNSTSNLSFRK